jgi:hypothetical protein
MADLHVLGHSKAFLGWSGSTFSRFVEQMLPADIPVAKFVARSHVATTAHAMCGKASGMTALNNCTDLSMPPRKEQPPCSDEGCRNVQSDRQLASRWGRQARDLPSPPPPPPRELHQLLAGVPLESPTNCLGGVRALRSPRASGF